MRECAVSGSCWCSQERLDASGDGEDKEGNEAEVAKGAAVASLGVAGAIAKEVCNARQDPDLASNSSISWEANAGKEKEDQEGWGVLHGVLVPALHAVVLCGLLLVLDVAITDASIEGGVAHAVLATRSANADAHPCQCQAVLNGNNAGKGSLLGQLHVFVFFCCWPLGCAKEPGLRQECKVCEKRDKA